MLENPPKSMMNTAPSQTPDFNLDESGFVLGVKAFWQLVVDYGR